MNDSQASPDRARQFLPYASLVGFDRYLADMEERIETAFATGNGAACSPGTDEEASGAGEADAGGEVTGGGAWDASGEADTVYPDEFLFREGDNLSPWDRW